MGEYTSPVSDENMMSYPGQPVDAELARTDMRRLAAAASRVRAAVVFVFLDAVCVIVGYSLAEVTFFHDKAPSDYWLHFSGFLGIAVVVTVVSNKMFGLYGRMWRHAGADEARQLLLSVAITLCVLIAFWPIGRLVHVALVPPFVVVVGCMFAGAGMGVLRFHSRLFAWQRGSKRLGLRVAVIGSRDAGAAAIREMLRSPGAGLVPVAVFDDDHRAHGLSLLGVPVVGGIGEIPKATSRYTIQQVLLAIPSPSPELVDRALRASEEAGVSMKMLPGVKDMLNEPNHLAALRQAREPQIEDLLGRTTSSRCGARSKATASWSPEPVVRSDRKSAARWPASGPPSSCYSTTTRHTCTTQRPQSALPRSRP
jgi:FlaA1/EpsC-like NDP-sugar epimerase